jgi:UDP-glucose 4-epimerase
VHLAGRNEVEAQNDPDGALSDTIIGTRRLAEAAASASANIGLFVYVSTIHVYGSAQVPGATITEDVVPQPTAAYSVSRLAAEHIVRSINDGVVLRLTNGVGAPAHPSVQRWTLVTNDLCREAVSRSTLTLRSDGSQWRDFISLTDICRIIANVTRTGIDPGTYNLGRGTPTTIRAIAQLVQDACERVLGPRPELIAPPERTPDERSVVSVDKLAKIGHRACMPIEHAIEETIRFCADHHSEIGE